MNDGFQPFPYDALAGSIPGRFARIVAARPEAMAVWTHRQRLTYAALDRASDAVAASLWGPPESGPEPVAVLLEQGLEAVVAILGILKAGHYYLPLDPSLPRPRLAAMLADSRTRRLVTSSTNASLAESLIGPDGAIIDVAAARRADLEFQPSRAVPPDAPAYLFYTSGSTGQPKAVIDCHRNVLHNVLRYTHGLRLGPRDRLSLIQSPGFSGTVSSLFAALLNGATVCPFPLRQEGFESLARWMDEAGITVFHSVPAILRGLSAGGRRFPGVRVVRLEGDQVLPGDVEGFRHGFAPPCSLAVGLGATETGLSCQYIILASGAPWEGLVPVGYPTPDMEVIIRDDAGRNVGPGEAGEIVVRSRYLATGYWRQPELTRAAFADDPTGRGIRLYRTGDRGRLRADGCVEFLGRMDGQPKILGQRVEAAEVEAALARVPGIGQGLVVIREDVPGAPRLVAYLVASSQPVPTLAAIRRGLSATLPDAMIPTACVFLEALPLNDQGKVDRRAALPAPGESARFQPNPARVEPRDEIEAALTGVWEAVLERPGLGVTEGFFDLGGDSLRAAAICARLEREWGWSVTPAMLETHSTIERLAASLHRPVEGRSAEPIVTFQSRGSGPPCLCVHDHAGSVLAYAALGRRLGNDRPCLGLRGASGTGSENRVETLEQLAAAHLTHVRAVQPAGPYRLIGLCFGGVLAFEMARQLVDTGAEVRLLALIGISPYDFPNLISPRTGELHRLYESRNRLGPNLRYHALWLRNLPLRELGPGLGSKLRSIGPFLRERWRRRTRAEGGGEAPGAAPTRNSAVIELHDRLFRNYRARPFPGRLSLLLSRSCIRPYSWDAGADWRGLAAGGVSVHLAPVPYQEMLREPFVSTLAGWLREDEAGRGCGD